MITIYELLYRAVRMENYRISIPPWKHMKPKPLKESMSYYVVEIFKAYEIPPIIPVWLSLPNIVPWGPFMNIIPELK